MSKFFITSDDHFYHKNIIKYCNRPWNHGFDKDGNMIITDEDVQNMNNELIENWNSVVNKDDIVFNLGDFCFLGKKTSPKYYSEYSKIFNCLNGVKYLLIGNHDIPDVHVHYKIGWKAVYDRPILWSGNIIFSHRPLCTKLRCDVSKLPFINIFGHIHNNGCDFVNGESVVIPFVTKNTFCACVELTNYKPILLSEIEDRIKEKSLENE